MIKTYMKENKKLYEVFVSDRDQNKKIISRRKRGITSEREAKELEFQYKTELRRIADQEPHWTWEKWHNEFLRRIRLSYKNSTVSNYDGYLKKWIPESWFSKCIDQITTDEVYEVIQASSVKLGSISQKNILKMLRKMFQTAVDEGLLNRNPTKGVNVKTPQTMQKVLTAREVEILLRSAKSTNHRFYYVWVFALQTGMRSGEMYALKWSDIDFDAGIISVNKQWTSKDGLHELKTGDWRVVPISKDLKSLLMELKTNQTSDSLQSSLPMNGKNSGEFVLPRLMEWTHGDQAKVLREFCTSIGISSIKFHDLRATFITNMLSQGVPLVKVMAIVGHKKMETTDIYLRLAGVDIKGATEALGYAVPQEVDQSNVISINFTGRK